MLSLIVAVNKKNVIGDSKTVGLLWHDRADLKNFQMMTMGRTLLVGSKTAKMLPPLYGRNVVVISRDSHVGIPFDQALKLYPDAMVIGGAEIYKLAIDSGQVKYWYVSVIDNDADGDIHFPIDLFHGNKTPQVFEQKMQEAS